MADRKRRPATSRTLRKPTKRTSAKPASRAAHAPKLYLARWPDLTATLISARDRTEAMEMLDELGDPGGCKIVEYHGPVWVELALPIEFTAGPSADAIAVRLPTDLDAIEPKASIPNTDTGRIFGDGVIETAFPEIAAALDARRKDQLDDDDARRELDQAVRRELLALLQYRWRRDAQRRHARAGDAEAALRETADATVDPRSFRRR